jgi:acyl-CoA thioesterase-1
MTEGADRRRWRCSLGRDDSRSNARLCLRGVAGAAVLYLTVVAAGCTSDAKPPAATPQSPSQESGALSRRADSTASAGRGTVLIVGTSLTAGLGLDPDQAYPALLQRKADSVGLPYRLVNAGLSGETSAGALRRVSWLLRQPVAVFVLETGANDGLRGLDVDSTKAHIAAILDSVRRADPQAALCLVQMEAPPNLGPQYTRAFHDVYPAVAHSQGATLLPFLLRGVAGQSGLNQADGMHPNVTGERIVAATVWSGLEPVLRARVPKPAAAPPNS